MSVIEHLEQVDLDVKIGAGEDSTRFCGPRIQATDLTDLTDRTGSGSGHAGWKPASGMK
jgi:hypothetical protein